MGFSFKRDIWKPVKKVTKAAVNPVGAVFGDKVSGVVTPTAHIAGNLLDKPSKQVEPTQADPSAFNSISDFLQSPEYTERKEKLFSELDRGTATQDILNSEATQQLNAMKFGGGRPLSPAQEAAFRTRYGVTANRALDAERTQRAGTALAALMKEGSLIAQEKQAQAQYNVASQSQSSGGLFSKVFDGLF